MQTTRRQLTTVIRATADRFVADDIKSDVTTYADINNGFCRHLAETVYESLGEPDDVEIREDGGMGYVHTWLEYNGRHFDAERPAGVKDYRMLPFFQRSSA